MEIIKTPKKYVIWTPDEWAQVFTGVAAMETLYAEEKRMPLKEMFLRAQKALPTDRQRPFSNNAVMMATDHYAAWCNGIDTLGWKKETEPKPEPKSLLDMIQPKTPPMPGTKELMERLNQTQAQIDSERSRLKLEQAQNAVSAGMKEEQIKKLLDLQRQEFAAKIGEMESRLSGLITSAYEKLAGMWLGDAEIPSLVPPVKPADLPEPPMFSNPVAQALSRKPKVMIFGAKPNQVQAVQQHLRSFEVVGTKDRAKATGDFAMVVIMKEFVRDDEADVIEKGHKGHTLRVKGGVTSAVNAVKNHFMIA